MINQSFSNRENEQDEEEDDDDDEDEEGLDEVAQEGVRNIGKKIQMKDRLLNYKCKYCNYSTKYKLHIIDHMYELHAIYLMECPHKECKKQFKDEWKLKRHLESNREHPALKLEYKNFLDIMKIHVVVGLYKPGFKCPVCVNEYLETYESLEEHCKSLHKDFNMSAYFICRQCGQLFRNIYKLKAHNSNVHGKKKTKLPQTEASNRMKQMHADDEMSTTSTTTSSITTTDKRIQAYEANKVVSSEKTCHVCMKVFKDSIKFQKHVQIQHGVNENGEPLIECPICERNFFNRQQLERHMHAHEIWVNDLNSCTGSNIPSQLNTIQHFNNNNNDNNTFNNAIDCWLSTTNTSLQKETNNLCFDNCATESSEMNILGDNKIIPDCRQVQSVLYCYECEICKFFFKSNKVLFKHKRSVHKLKPIFRCLLGDKCDVIKNGVNGEFDSLDAFLEHAKIHSQKNIYCSRCKMQFDGKVSLRNHMKNVHYRSSSEFNCNYCKIKFKSKDELDEHNKVTTHKVKNNAKTQNSKQQKLKQKDKQETIDDLTMIRNSLAIDLNQTTQLQLESQKLVEQKPISQSMCQKNIIVKVKNLLFTLFKELIFFLFFRYTNVLRVCKNLPRQTLYTII